MDQEKEDLNVLSKVKKETKAQTRSEKALNGVIGGIVFSIPFIILAWWLYKILFDFAIGKILVCVLGFFAFVCLMVALSSYFDLREAKKIERLLAEAEREEREFSEIELDKRALRAEKLFKLNQKELMRYYNMNIAQTKFLSGLGIFMIVFGALIVAVSIFIYASFSADKVILLVGSLSGIMVDFIGTIFIKMYTQNIDAAIKFHAIFAESNTLLLANSIANKIEDATLRENTLSDISKSIVLSKNNSGN